MKVLLIGADGQVGQALRTTVPSGASLALANRATLDVSSRDAVFGLVEREQPNLIINAAAYTQVDKAEDDEAVAHSVNAIAVEHLSRAAEQVEARLVHFSTDFVFDGMNNRPYLPDAQTCPINAYGRTKRAGELAMREDALLIRTAWVYGRHGANFVRTILRLAREKSEFSVVDDQIGTPTNALGLAEATWGLIQARATGVYHYTDSGVASWYDFAIAVQEEASEAGLIDRAARILPVSTTDFPTPARRPAFSVLDKQKTWQTIGRAAPHWRTSLRNMLRDPRDDG